MVIIIIQTFYLDIKCIFYFFSEKIIAFLRKFKNLSLKIKSYKISKKSIDKIISTLMLQL